MVTWLLQNQRNNPEMYPEIGGKQPWTNILSVCINVYVDISFIVDLIGLKYNRNQNPDIS